MERPVEKSTFELSPAKAPLRRLAVERGATRDERLETPGMAIHIGAQPTARRASHAIGAFARAEAPQPQRQGAAFPC